MSVLEQAQQAVDRASRRARPRARLAAVRGKRTAEQDLEGDLSTSDDAIALAFVEQFGHLFRWSPGLGWMRNIGDHWACDEELFRFDLARKISRQTALACGDEKIGNRVASSKTVNAVVSLAQSDRRIVLPASEWDRDTFLLNTPDGVVDLRTGMQRTLDGDYHTQVARVGPDHNHTPTAWLKFIDQVFLGDPEMIEFIQRLLGYILTGDRREQKLFFMYGLGANGKSTLVDLVLWIVGTYGVKLPATTLMQAGVDRHPTELAQLRGKRLAMSSEIDEGLYWAESRIKELTGDETLTARFMRQDFFEFAMTQKHLIVGNYKPRMRGGDAALARRFVLVPFNAKFQGAARDPRMLERLRSEAPAVLAWMVKGAVKWADSGLAIPASVTAASSEYMSENDDVSLWLVECCDQLPDARSKASDLYECFAHWIKSRGQHVPSMRVWGERIALLPGISKVISNGVRYVGLRLNADQTDRLLSLQRGGVR